jgi:hypothetical protein
MIRPFNTKELVLATLRHVARAAKRPRPDTRPSLPVSCIATCARGELSVSTPTTIQSYCKWLIQ